MQSIWNYVQEQYYLVYSIKEYMYSSLYRNMQEHYYLVYNVIEYMYCSDYVHLLFGALEPPSTW